MPESPRLHSSLRSRGLLQGLFACLLISALWLYSCWHSTGIQFTLSPLGWISFQGDAGMLTIRSSGVITGVNGILLFADAPPLASGFFSRNHRRWDSHYSPGPTAIYLILPYWYLLALYMSATGFICFRTPHANHPTCPSCRYNLTGLPPSTTRCPECGSLRTPLLQRAERGDPR